MRFPRLVVAVLILATLIVASFRTTSSSASAPVEAPCTTTALAGAFSGQFHLASIDNYGCEGGWAFVWATVGQGEQAIGVTEVLAYDETTATWSFVSRASDCKATILPSVVYRQGCFSN
jgi:hypothetical protein